MSGKNLFVIIIMLSSLLWSNETQEAPNNDSKQIYVIQLNNGDTISGEILDNNEINYWKPLIKVVYESNNSDDGILPYSQFQEYFIFCYISCSFPIFSCSLFLF